MAFRFSHRKATQALNFLAKAAGGSINKMKALKLIFFADRYHLRKYGRPVIGDAYLAMNYGPVASNTKDLAEFTQFLGKEESSYAALFLRPEDRYSFSSQGEVDPLVVSTSDMEALQWSWDTFGGKDHFTLSEITHFYPEWSRHEASIEAGRMSRVEMDYRDFLLNPPPGVDPCHDLTEEDMETLRLHLSETAEIGGLLY